MAEVARVFAPTDFSPAADRATRRAASVASALGSVLHLAHVLPPREVLEQLFPTPLEKEVEAFHARAERALSERGQRIAAQFSITPICQLFHGRAHQAILDAIVSVDAHLVVIGAQGEREGVLPPNTAGDTALKIAGQARVPTLLVRREAQQPYGHVVGCVKAEPADRIVIEWTSTMSPADLVHIVSAYSVPYERRLLEWGASQSTIDVYSARERDERTNQLSRLLSDLGLPAARARLHVERGEPLSTILGTAAQWEADLIVAGRRTGLDPLSAGPMGSRARGIALLAPMDVMIVPPSRRSQVD